MDHLIKKRRDTSRFAAERGIAQALKGLGPTIASANARLARCRAVASLSKPGYAQQILAECQVLRAEISGVRLQLEEVVSALPTEQAGSSRIRDTRLALDRLDLGVDDILETAAAGTSPTAKAPSWSTSRQRPPRDASPRTSF